MAERARSAEVDELRAQLAANQPYLELAQQIHAEIERVTTDPMADLGELADVIDRWPREARHAAVTAAFGELAAGARWEILARLFDDDELRAALAVEHERAVVRARVTTATALDTRLLPAGEELVVGLFREVDVRAALARGSSSTAVARRLVLRATDQPGRLLVLEDLFNPERGLFVTLDYDESRWRAERLDPYAVVTVGAAIGEELQPVIYPGGRLDIATADGICIGRLHTGFVTVGGADVFTSSTQKETD